MVLKYNALDVYCYPLDFGSHSSIHLISILKIATKEGRKVRPLPLNTVNLLKVASQKLGIGPHTAMHIAERL